MKIFGAGLAGLLAGCAFPRAELFEASPASVAQHKALLRFRTSSVGLAVGVDFRRVRVRKGLWDNGPQQPSIFAANLYARKVVGRLVDRSVWNLETVDRWIAPEDFVEILVEKCGERIHWEHQITDLDVFGTDEPIVSTLPMPVMEKITGSISGATFRHAPIEVRRWRIPGADVFQTIYFPSPETTLYRASITGNLLIAEFVDSGDDYDFFPAFGLHRNDCEAVEKVSQRYGKIAPIEEHLRKNFVFTLTAQRNIFSLGRFATWRNILLDDVLQDISVIKRLLHASPFDRARATAR